MLRNLPTEIQSFFYMIMTLKGQAQSYKSMKFTGMALAEVFPISCTKQESPFTPLPVVRGLLKPSNEQKIAQKQQSFGMMLMSQRSKHIANSIVSPISWIFSLPWFEFGLLTLYSLKPCLISCAYEV